MLLFDLMIKSKYILKETFLYLKSESVFFFLNELFTNIPFLFMSKHPYYYFVYVSKY